jgi:TPR repeat protein
MRSLIKTFFLMLMLSVNHTAIAGEFEDALAVYERQDFSTALRLFTPLAGSGNAEAQFYLGSMYDEGKGVQMDTKAAVKWYTLAADQGNASAQLGLGLLYSTGGFRVRKDNLAAFKYYKLAAEQGNIEAQQEIGLLYRMGWGVQKDYVRAYMWYTIGYGNSTKGRFHLKSLTSKMTPIQIEKAQEISAKCIKRNFKNCDYIM